ncbi:MAG TPA: ATP-binding protein, partial [Telluria sp.]|nr:ATP-binding protein [Telluria sp.]
PEFDRRVLEVLRQPLESGVVTISRALRHSDFPARFQLVAAMNPCPCGYKGHASGKCHCTPDRILRYQERISGPLLDRIDIQIEVPALGPEFMSPAADGEPSAAIAPGIAAAAQRQLARQGKPNQMLGTREIERFCIPDAEGEEMLRRSMLKFQWSARSYHRILRVARTIADLAGACDVASGHVSEAVGYRRALYARPADAQLQSVDDV